MSLTQVQHVKVGSIVRVKGAEYKVAANRIANLVLHKKVGIAVEERDTYLNDLIGKTNYDTLVEVTGQPIALSQSLTDKLKAQLNKPETNGLTEQLRKQKAQQDLTSSLRGQLSESEDDLDDEDDDEDEEDDFDGWYSGCLPSASAYQQQAPVGWTQVFEEQKANDAKKVALSASLRAQAAQQQALQSRVESKAAVSQLGKRLDVHERAHNALADLVERNVFNQAVTEDTLSRGIAGLNRDIERAFDSVEEQVNELDDYVCSVSDVAHNALRKVEAIESKQKREELKMNIQQQLNASLAQKSEQKSNKTIGGNGTMKNVFGAFKNQFGKVEGQFAYSVVTSGLALRKGISNEFVAYDKAAKTLTDVSGLTLQFDAPAFKLPVKETEIAVGDLIIHNGEYVYVTGKADGYLETINPVKAVRGSVIPTKNALFGAAFYTVVKTLDAAGEGGFNPMLLMALGKGNKEELLPLLLMSGGLGNTANGAIDPTLLMLLGDEVEDLLPLVLMQQGGVAGQGFNPLMFLAMNKGGKLGDMLPFLMMQQGGQAGAMNPMMLMALQDGGSDMKDLLLMQALTGQNLFGQAPAAPVQTQSTKGNK